LTLAVLSCGFERDPLGRAYLEGLGGDLWRFVVADGGGERGGGKSLARALDLSGCLSARAHHWHYLILGLCRLELVAFFCAFHAGWRGDWLLELDGMDEQVSVVLGALLKAGANEVFPREFHRTVLGYIDAMQMGDYLFGGHLSRIFIIVSRARGHLIIFSSFLKEQEHK
jgi:hypothetical protein